MIREMKIFEHETGWQQEYPFLVLPGQCYSARLNDGSSTILVADEDGSLLDLDDSVITQEKIKTLALIGEWM